MTESEGYLFMASQDFNIYAVNLINGKIRWQFVTGVPVLIGPKAIGENLYVAPKRSGLYQLSTISGRQRWWQPNLTEFLAESQHYTFATDQRGDVVILDRDSGGPLGVLPLRHFSVRISNERTDRLIMATPSRPDHHDPRARPGVPALPQKPRRTPPAPRLRPGTTPGPATVRILLGGGKMQLFPEFKDTLVGAAADLAAGKRSCQELVERCFQNIETREAEVRAWVLLDRDGAHPNRKRPRCRAEGRPIPRAAAWDPHWHQRHCGCGRLAHGGRLETYGRQHRPARCPHRPAAEKRGGGDPRQNRHHAVRQLRSPRDQKPLEPRPHSPGGSSSGSAAAVAAGMCLGAVGTQTGGSITRPAAFCGVAGLKPTYGSVSLEGIVPLSAPMDNPGPLARTVRDTAAMFAVMADFADGQTGLAPEWKSLLDQTKFPPPRLGTLGGFFQEQADPHMLHCLMHAMEQWINHGAFMESIELPREFDEVLPNHRILMAKGAANYHGDRFAQHPDDYQPAIRILIEEGLTIPKSFWEQALAFQKTSREMILSLFEEVDVLAAPASVGTAPDLSTTGDPVMNSPWSFCGFPTLTFPMALSEEDGLPLGVQLIGKPGAELTLYQAGLWCESFLHNLPPA